MNNKGSSIEYFRNDLLERISKIEITKCKKCFENARVSNFNDNTNRTWCQYCGEYRIEKRGVTQ